MTPSDPRTGADRGAPSPLRVATPRLRWRCDPATLDFKTTAEVEPVLDVIGQDEAVESLRFGLEIDAPGQNVFVRGLVGVGRLTLLHRLLETVQLYCPLPQDRCYVHNFDEPDRPRLLTLPRATARALRKRVDEMIDFIREELAPALESDALRDRRDALVAKARARTQELVQPFEKELKAHSLALGQIEMGSMTQFVLVPLVEGKPTPPEEYETLVAQGQVPEEQAERVRSDIDAYSRRLEEVTVELERLRRSHRDEVRRLVEEEARRILARVVATIESEHPQEQVKEFLAAIVSDVAERRLGALQPDSEGDFTRQYRVNVVADHSKGEACPVVIESLPSLQNLFGGVEREFLPGGGYRSDHLMVRAGSLLRADGGYLLLEAREVLLQPGAWRALMRALRTGQVDVNQPEFESMFYGPSLKPEPADINVKVILIGDPGLYSLLDQNDPDFPHLFKVLADFDDALPRTPDSVRAYAGVLSRITREELLPALDRSAVAAIAEHGARVAGRSDRLTTQFGRIVDIVREAGFIARRRGADPVDAAAVLEAIRQGRRRADLPARKFRQLVKEGTIRVQTSGHVVGQVNGLAVVHAGPLVYGFPARITATIGPGTAGAIDIEREAQLSGAIHTKGFYILGGLLRHLLRTSHALAFSASIAFEQSYGGIDGDSASGAEMCCLLSALTEVPLRQDLAMTGAIDQHGHIQPIGAVTEKIEGYFDVCQEIGLTGAQGVIIPSANVIDLMLRDDVVAACDVGRFHVYAVDRIHDALELFTGLPAGVLGDDGAYPDGTLLRRAVERAHDYWKRAVHHPPPEGRKRAAEE
ncbi:MAG: Lon protease family protein [Planctomycetota bacterium]